MRRVLTIGTFDPLHLGHLGLFEQCRRIAGPDAHLTVGVNSDAFVTSYRGTPPMLPENVRAGVIAATTLVDDVVLNTSHDGQSYLILDCKPDLLVIGQDWALKDYPAQLGVRPNWFEDHGIQLVYVPRTGDWSSTALKTPKFDPAKVVASVQSAWSA